MTVLFAANFACILGFCEATGADREESPFVLPRSVSVPKDNPTKPAKIELGRQCFFDPRFSVDNTMSCATCHLPDKAFGDGLLRAKGAGGKELTRNTPTLLNVGFYSTFF
jgi:cytochrome c peroxidase